MALDSETIRLALEVTQTQTVAEAIAKLDQMAMSAKAAGNSVDALTLQTLAYKLSIDSEVNALDQEVIALAEATTAQKLMRQMLEQTTVASTRASVAVGGETKGQSGLGRSALQASYAFQDFTSQLGSGPGGFARALGSIQNNIPGILMGFGVGGTVIAGVSVLTVALGALVTNWDLLVKGMTSDAIKKAKDDLEALAKKVDEYNALLGKPNRAEAAGGKIIEDAITEGGAAKIAKGLSETMTATGRGEKATPDERARMDQLAASAAKSEAMGWTVQAANLRAAVKAIQEDISARQAKTVQALMIDVKAPGVTGKDARDTMRALVNANPTDFPAGFLGDLERADPADVKRQQGFETERDLNRDNAKRADKAQADKRAEAAKAAHARAQMRDKRIAEEAKIADAEDKEEADAEHDRQKAIDDQNAAGFRQFVRRGQAAGQERRRQDQQQKQGARQAQQEQNRMAAAALKTQTQAIDDQVEAMQFNAKAMQGILTNAEKVAHAAYWAKRQAQDLYERSRQSPTGSSLDN